MIAWHPHLQSLGSTGQDSRFIVSVRIPDILVSVRIPDVLVSVRIPDVPVSARIPGVLVSAFRVQSLPTFHTRFRKQSLSITATKSG